MIDFCAPRIGALCALLLMGCHETPQALADAGADSPTASAAPSLAGSKVSLALEGGGRITLPANAVKKDDNPNRQLPEMVRRAHIYRMESNKRLLMVNELSLEGRGCDAALDEELGRMQAAKEDSDPARLRFRRMGKVEVVKVAGERVLYGESKNRGMAGLDAGRPMVAMANMLMCRDSHLLLMMYASDQPLLAAGAKQMLLDIAASYVPGGG